MRKNVTVLSVLAPAMASLVVSACTSIEGPRDPRLDRGNIWNAARGSSAYTEYVNELSRMSAATVQRERASRERNLMLLSDLSEAEAKRQALSEEVASLKDQVAELNRQSAAAQAQTDEDREKLASLNARRDALEARAIAIADAPEEDLSALEDELTAVQAEQRVLLREYESMI